MLYICAHYASKNLHAALLNHLQVYSKTVQICQCCLCLESTVAYKASLPGVRLGKTRRVL